MPVGVAVSSGLKDKLAAPHLVFYLLHRHVLTTCLSADFTVVVVGRSASRLSKDSSFDVSTPSLQPTPPMAVGHTESLVGPGVTPAASAEKSEAAEQEQMSKKGSAESYKPNVLGDIVDEV